MTLVTIECDDGYKIMLAISQSVTVREIIGDICRDRKTSTSCEFDPAKLSMVGVVSTVGSTHEVLLSSNLSLLEMVEKLEKIMVIGCLLQRTSTKL